MAPGRAAHLVPARDRQDDQGQLHDAHSRLVRGGWGERPAAGGEHLTTATHPYQVPPGEKPDEKESAWMLVAEPRGLPLPPEWRKQPGAAIIATVLWQILGPAHRVPPVVPTPP